MNKFVESNLNTPNSLQIVAARWRGLLSALGSLNIAHNDLQHGNVMVQQDRSLRLVDYDAMFLPQYAGQASPENGASTLPASAEDVPKLQRECGQLSGPRNLR